MALVIVLACLVFLAALGIAFLSSSGTELKSSKTFAEGGNAQLLAQSAVNLVMAQIADGTKGVDENRNTLAWASQPGMIRTYTDQGEKAAYYRLYSWDVMTVTDSGKFDPNADAGQMEGWADSPAVFTDLNQPSKIGGVDICPIADPSAAGKVAGFAIGDNTPLASGHPLPMPVKWLYVLKNGQIIAPPEGSSGKVVTFSGSKPTDDNPIVGRIAFWTDDETCKVNLNTAGAGTYWDTPRFANTQDRAFGTRQPIRNEYQRYPGHPATTSLQTVFPDLSKEVLYELLPRLRAGGSKGGTVATAGPGVPASVPLAIQGRRLLASNDEFLFQPGFSGTERAKTSDNITADLLRKTGFFTTVSSRSPDLNLFNRPRVSIWPIHEREESTFRSAFDRLIAFASTVGGHPFYFQRKEPNSAFVDLPSGASPNGVGRNRGILEYLRMLTSQPVPGFGGKFSQKYSAANGKGGTERDQILTEIFDYIRSVNLTDQNVASPYTPKATLQGNGNFGRGQGTVVPIVDQTNGTRGFGRFPTVHEVFLHIFADDSSYTAGIPPGEVELYAGIFVQLFIPSQGYVMFYPDMRMRISGNAPFTWGYAGTVQSMGFPSNNNVDIGAVPYWGGDDDRLGGVYGFTQFARHWHDNWQAYPACTLSGNATVNGQISPNPGGLNNQRVPLRVNPLTNPTITFSGGTVRIQLLDKNGLEVQDVTVDFPLIAQLPVPSPSAALTATNEYGGVVVNLRRFISHIPGEPNVGNPLFVGRLGANKYSNIILGGDVVRAMVLTSGDARIPAARGKIIPADGLFGIHSSDYNDSGQLKAHTIRSGMKGAPTFDPANKGLANGFSGGNLLPNVTMPDVAKPDLPPSVNGVFQEGGLPGDWDNAVGPYRDGPYINKPDEGTLGGSVASSPPYFPDGAPTDPVVQPTLFTPNRQIASAVQFGSLPTGSVENQPWQTLQFRPDPAGHPGLASPPDHLLLDLFHMPVVEPYAISEPLSTDGRINMNYQIVPFTYITRETGIRAILAEERVPSVPDRYVLNYKTTTGVEFRQKVNADQTLLGFKQRFDSGDIFRSASEICSLPIVPTDGTYQGMSAYWNERRLTGDNSRERPYSTIYPRLTTKSNTFTIYYRAQALKKVKGTKPETWNEDQDRVTGEFRGYQTVERYIDPSSNAIQEDYANPSVTRPISDFYKFRVLQAKQFGQ